MDARRDELERRFRETGALEDETALLRHRVRSGELREAAVALAARLGREAAARAVGDRPWTPTTEVPLIEELASPMIPSARPPELLVLLAEASAVGAPAPLRAAIACCRELLAREEDWARRDQDTPLIERVVHVAERAAVGDPLPAAAVAEAADDLRAAADRRWAEILRINVTGPWLGPAIRVYLAADATRRLADGTSAGEAADREVLDAAGHLMLFVAEMDGEPVSVDLPNRMTDDSIRAGSLAVRDAVAADLVPWLLGRGDPIRDRLA